MNVSSFGFSSTLDIMNVSVAEPYGSAGFTAELMVMTFICVCSEFYLMHVILTVADRDCFSCNDSESVIMAL